VLQVLHFWQAKAMALQVAVQAARRRLNGKQPAQLPPIPASFAVNFDGLLETNTACNGTCAQHEHVCACNVCQLMYSNWRPW